MASAIYDFMDSKCGCSAMKRLHQKGFEGGQTALSSCDNRDKECICRIEAALLYCELRPKPHVESLDDILIIDLLLVSPPIGI